MSIEDRKNQHLDIVLQQAIEHDGSGLLGQVQLIHQSLPELDLDEIDCSVRVFGKQVASPLMISGMTGGSQRAQLINRQLASVAEATGTTMGVGSMRPALGNAARRADYDLREVAPTVPLLGNLGVIQAKETPVDEMGDLLRDLGYNGLCIHLNPAQELAQKEGDRDFTGCLAAIATYRADLGLPVIVKETGAGLSAQALDALRSRTGVDWVDVAGMGGTSWTKVEGHRPDAPAFGSIFGEWGIPTAASTAWAANRGFKTICSGGVRSPLDVLAGLALGATLVGTARPVLMALEESTEAAQQVLETWIEAIRRGMLLCGAKRPAAMRRCPNMIGPDLRAWLELDAASTASGRQQ